MRSLSDTLERLARFRKDKSGHAATARSKLSRLQRFGSNPELCKLGTMFLSA